MIALSSVTTPTCPVPVQVYSAVKLERTHIPMCALIWTQRKYRGVCAKSAPVIVSSRAPEHAASTCLHHASEIWSFELMFLEHNS